MNDNRDKRLEDVQLGLIDVDNYLKKPGLCECGNAYTYQGLGRYQCEHCGNVFLNEYGTVREFVEKYGTNYSILEIAEMTGVSKKLIDMFVRDGKFIEVERQRMCIVCHQPIDSGLYCKRCALQQIGNDMEENRRNRNIMGSLKNENMRGTMHHGRRQDR